jgi:hypothetical protein
LIAFARRAARDERYCRRMRIMLGIVSLLAIACTPASGPRSPARATAPAAAPAAPVAAPAVADPAARIAALGGTVSYDDAGRVMRVDLHETKITDADLIVLRELPELRELDLRKTAITDAGLAHVAPLAKLRFLNVFRTPMTDRGLALLAQLTGGPPVVCFLETVGGGRCVARRALAFSR